LVRFVHVHLGRDRSHVRIDDKCHGYVLFLDVSWMNGGSIPPNAAIDSTGQRFRVALPLLL
jgi:hypothetical protein